MSNSLVDKIDALLPQTQCGLCDYSGCKPYAQAIANNEAPINHCYSGGIATLKKLGAALNQDVSGMLAEMKQRQQPPQVAFIIEEACIGCTKCIQACPVDAIVGANKLMHTIITDDCNGCELCIEPCPMDCIELKAVAPPTDKQKQFNEQRNRINFEKHEARLKRIKQEKTNRHQQAKLKQQDSKLTKSARQQAIAAALARVKNNGDR